MQMRIKKRKLIAWLNSSHVASTPQSSTVQYNSCHIFFLWLRLDSFLFSWSSQSSPEKQPHGTTVTAHYHSYLCLLSCSHILWLQSFWWQQKREEVRQTKIPLREDAGDEGGIKHAGLLARRLKWSPMIFNHIFAGIKCKHFLHMYIFTLSLRQRFLSLWLSAPPWCVFTWVQSCKPPV